MSDIAPLKIMHTANDLKIKPCGVKNLVRRPLCKAPGSDSEILYSVLTLLSLPYQLLPPPKNVTGVGRYENGTWHDGFFAYIQNGDYDLMSNTFVKTAIRSESFEFSYVTQDLELVFLTAGAPEQEEGTAKMLLQVFSWEIWLALLGCTLVILLCHIVGHYITLFKNQKEFLRVGLTAYGVVISIFLNLFASGLLTDILHPATNHNIRNVWHMIDLIAKKQISLVSPFLDDFTSEMIRHSEDYFFVRLRDALSHNPMEVSDSEEEIALLVANGTHVAVTTDTDVEGFKNYSCNLRMITERDELELIPKLFPMSFMFRKDSPLVPKFNNALIHLRAHTEMVIHKYANMKAAKHCIRPERSRRVDALQLMSMSGGFALLIIMHFFSLIVMCIERTVAGHRSYNQKQIEENQPTIGMATYFASEQNFNWIGRTKKIHPMVKERISKGIRRRPRRRSEDD